MIVCLKEKSRRFEILDFRGALGPPLGGGGMKARVQGRHCPPARQRGENLVFHRKLVQKLRFWGAPGPRRRHEPKRGQEYDVGGAQLYEWGVGPGGKSGSKL